MDLKVRDQHRTQAVRSVDPVRLTDEARDIMGFPDWKTSPQSLAAECAIQTLREDTPPKAMPEGPKKPSSMFDTIVSSIR